MKLALFLSIPLLIANFSFFNLGNSFENSNVIDDLKSISNFNFNDYKKNSASSVVNPPSIISFIENGYSFSKKVNSSNFGLYAIIYNPDLISFDFNSTLNKIELSAGNQDNFFKFHLDYLNDAYDSLYIKFKVSLSSGDKEKINESLNRDERIYRISGIELKKKESTNASDYFTQKNKMGGIYSYTGFAKNMGKSGVNDSSLNYTVNDLYTLNLDVKDTYYRFNSPDYAISTQLDSVYFGVPNEVLNNYGSLEKIKCEYNEYKTSPIFVLKTDDVPLFNSWVGKKQTSDNHCNYSLITTSSFGDTKEAGGVYYGYDSVKVDMPLNYVINSNKWVNNMSYLFDGGTFGLNDISRDVLKTYIYSYNKSHFDGYTDKGISMDLLNGKIDDGHKQGLNVIEISKNDNLSLTTFNGNSAWDYFFNIWKKESEVVNIDPIVKVNSVLNKTSKDLYINDYDLNSFKSYYSDGLLNNKSTFLFRFSSGKYFHDLISDYKYGDVSFEGTDGYVAQENVYFDFDIISLTFSKNGIEYLIPAVSDPIDIIADIVHPEEGSLWASILKVLKIALLVIFVLLGIWLVDKIFRLFGISFKDIFNFIFVKPIKAIKRYFHKK